MRKTKENLARPSQIADSEIRETTAAMNEERAQAMGGEMATEGLGAGYESESDEGRAHERAEASADGPLAGDETDPPTKKRKQKRKVKDEKHGIAPANSKSNHPAEHSSKMI